MPYARPDLAYVFVSEAHGGCGQPHRRPVENGAPAKVWSEDCVKCNDFLRHDSNWSTTLAELPETYDRRLERERDEKMGKLDRENQLAEALISLQNLGQLPAAFAQVVEAVTGTPSGALAGKTVCPQGHDNKAATSSAPSAGHRCTAAANAIEAPQAQDSAHHTPPQEPGPAARKQRMRDMKREDLAAIARKRGVDDSGTRMELIDRLRAVPAAA